MYYRTKTYLAGDWDNDIDAIGQILEWNNSNYYSKLDFVNVHEFIQSRDTSLPCSIKKSLLTRMKMSKTFILVVGKHTKTIRKGSCMICPNHQSFYNPKYVLCKNGGSISTKSFVEYECELAVKHGLDIVVLYNFLNVDKSQCPEMIRDIGVHVPMKCRGVIGIKWNYAAVRDAINSVSN